MMATECQLRLALVDNSKTISDTVVILLHLRILPFQNTCNSNKSNACGANARLQLLLENSKSKRGITMSKKLRVTCANAMGSPFDSKQLV